MGSVTLLITEWEIEEAIELGIGTGESFNNETETMD